MGHVLTDHFEGASDHLVRSNRNAHGRNRHTFEQTILPDVNSTVFHREELRGRTNLQYVGRVGAEESRFEQCVKVTFTKVNFNRTTSLTVAMTVNTRHTVGLNFITFHTILRQIKRMAVDRKVSKRGGGGGGAECRFSNIGEAGTRTLCKGHSLFSFGKIRLVWFSGLGFDGFNQIGPISQKGGYRFWNLVSNEVGITYKRKIRDSFIHYHCPYMYHPTVIGVQ